MRIYQVGGSIRDKLLNKTSQDRDFVVIGATEEEMLYEGYKKVGKSFPVFLHPKTQEEYALARKEIKTGPTHKDFKFEFTPDITLEEDSIRRDFTCNAIYQDVQTGEIIDYHNGIKDIKNKVLRHVSEHFSEDPLRVLRMCRFAAQLGFDVAPETMKLCQDMVKNGDMKHLSKERIWQEFEKALSYPTCYKFVEKARECGVLKELLPELEYLWEVPERKDYHPEGNSGEHTMLALKKAQSPDPIVNFTILFHDVGKGLTDKKLWPSHHHHDEYGAELIKTIGKRIKAPEKYIKFASFAISKHMLYHKKIEDVEMDIALTAIELSEQKNDSYKNRFIDVMKADMQGRALPEFTSEIEHFNIFQQYLEHLVEKAKTISVSDLPNFEELIDKVKQHQAPASIIKETLAKSLLK